MWPGEEYSTRASPGIGPAPGSFASRLAGIYDLYQSPLENLLRRLESELRGEKGISPDAFKHVLPPSRPDGASRVGYMLPAETIAKKCEALRRDFQNLKPPRIQTLLMQLFNPIFCDSNSASELDIFDQTELMNHRHIGKFLEFRDRGQRLNPYLQLLFAANCPDGYEINANLPNIPFKTEQYSHSRAGEISVSLEKAEELLLLNLKSLKMPWPQKRAIMKAIEITKQAHTDQKRKNGEPYAVHPFEAACILIKVGYTDPMLIIGALFHDLGEDTKFLAKNARPGEQHWLSEATATIQENFTELLTDKEIDRLAKMVWRVTKPEVTPDGRVLNPKIEADKREIQRLHFDLIRNNYDAIVLKGVDRYHNNETIDVKKTTAVGNYQWETRQEILPLYDGYRGKKPPEMIRLYHVLHFSNVMVMRLYSERLNP